MLRHVADPEPGYGYSGTARSMDDAGMHVSSNAP